MSQVNIQQEYINKNIKVGIRQEQNKNRSSIKKVHKMHRDTYQANNVKSSGEFRELKIESKTDLRQGISNLDCSKIINNQKRAGLTISKNQSSIASSNNQQTYGPVLRQFEYKPEFSLSISDHDDVGDRRGFKGSGKQGQQNGIKNNNKQQIEQFNQNSAVEYTPILQNKDIKYKIEEYHQQYQLNHNAPTSNYNGNEEYCEYKTSNNYAKYRQNKEQCKANASDMIESIQFKNNAYPIKSNSSNIHQHCENIQAIPYENNFDECKMSPLFNDINRVVHIQNHSNLNTKNAWSRQSQILGKKIENNNSQLKWQIKQLLNLTTFSIYLQDLKQVRNRITQLTSQIRRIKLRSISNKKTDEPKNSDIQKIKQLKQRIRTTKKQSDILGTKLTLMQNYLRVLQNQKSKLQSKRGFQLDQQITNFGGHSIYSNKNQYKLRQRPISPKNLNNVDKQPGYEYYKKISQKRKVYKQYFADQANTTDALKQYAQILRQSIVQTNLYTAKKIQRLRKQRLNLRKQVQITKMKILQINNQSRKYKASSNNSIRKLSLTKRDIKDFSSQKSLKNFEFSTRKQYRLQLRSPSKLSKDIEKSLNSEIKNEDHTYLSGERLQRKKHKRYKSKGQNVQFANIRNQYFNI